MDKETQIQSLKRQMIRAQDSCEKIAKSLVTPPILKNEKPLLAQAHEHITTSYSEIGHAMIQLSNYLANTDKTYTKLQNKKTLKLIDDLWDLRDLCDTINHDLQSIQDTNNQYVGKAREHVLTAKMYMWKCRLKIIKHEELTPIAQAV